MKENNNSFDSRRGDKPTFAILSKEKDFGISECIKKMKKIPPNNIFVIINGQQSLNIMSNDVVDDQFGQSLTGGDRVGKTDDFGIWKGLYKIHTTDSYESVASVIFDEFGRQDIVIDILNAKYEWGESFAKNTVAFNDFLKNFERILKNVNKITEINFFIAGFSRGGMFSLRLAKWLEDNNYGKKRVVVTIDPVEKFKKEKKYIDSWAYWNFKKRKWTISSGKKRPYKGFNDLKFPIFKATKAKHYNVFERDNMWSNFFAKASIVNLPIGSAVKGAIAPPRNFTRGKTIKIKYKKLPQNSPYDQFDFVNHNHTEMPNKYKNWIIDIIHDNFISPKIKIIPESGNYGEYIKITGSVKRAYGVYIDGAKVHSVWNEKENSIDFKLTKKIKAGKKIVSVGFSDFKVASSSFVFKPFLLDCYPLRVSVNKTVIITGIFDSDVDVFLGKKKIKTIIGSGKNFILFNIPENTVPGKKVVFLRNKKGITSNKCFVIVCDLIGNTNSKELHKLDCKWVLQMKDCHKKLFYSKIDKPKNNGYDNCFWCIGNSLR